jgi:hypothetical protein
MPPLKDFLVEHDLTLGIIANETTHDHRSPGLGLVCRTRDRHFRFEPRMVELDIRKTTN